MKYLIVSLAVLLAAGSAFGQEQEVETTEAETTETETTQESVPDEISDSVTPQVLLEAMTVAQEKAEAEYGQLLVKLEEDTIVRLKELAMQKAAKGDIAAAKDAWLELLKLDPSNVDGKEFFEAIGTWDDVRKQVAKARKSSNRRISKIEYRCASGRIFRKMSNGLWSDSHNPARYREVDRNEYSVTITPMTRSAEVHLLLPDHFIWARQKDWNKGQRYRGEDGAWVR